jgi:hypothetical protein
MEYFFMKIVTEETLHFLFMDEGYKDSFEFASFCLVCGVDVTVKVVKSTGGFGLLGGVLYESDLHTLTVKCLGCAEANNKLPHSLIA